MAHDRGTPERQAPDRSVRTRDAGQGDLREKLLLAGVFAAVAGVGAGAIYLSEREFYDDANGASDPMEQVPPEVFVPCWAEAVALHQHLHAQAEADPAAAPAFTADFEDRFEQMRRRASRYTDTDYPESQALVAPAMAAAQTARDEALAEDAAAYRETAWARMTACHAEIFSGDTP
ncbi:hypothetical protein [Gymnodinialimonas ceratoperidinii]|uniref:Uncharacterized protein n=1 Tax=Gymnodinialimonas ceratoperidinii TaxID=2856823 RepID=A0A8F6TXE8_9RHOB|nr:hypothetical protein [Gymnodinialimonas ceratoperidinii]QXT40470.1 hypothetical protein KYE46_04265 [Gymnodinialimonas ceratoperidinii]